MFASSLASDRANAQSSRSSLPPIGYLAPSTTPFEPATANLLEGVKFSYGCGGMVLDPVSDAAAIDHGFVRRTAIGGPGFVPCPSPLHNIVGLGGTKQMTPDEVRDDVFRRLAAPPLPGAPVGGEAPLFHTSGGVSVSGLPATKPVSRSFIGGGSGIGVGNGLTQGTLAPAPAPASFLRPVSLSGANPAPIAPQVAPPATLPTNPLPGGVIPGRPVINALVVPPGTASPLTAPPTDRPGSRLY